MQCGDKVITIEGQVIGWIHCWVKGGASVQLDIPRRVILDGLGCVQVDHIIITDEMFASGQFIATSPTAVEAESELEMLRRLV